MHYNTVNSRVGLTKKRRRDILTYLIEMGVMDEDLIAHLERFIERGKKNMEKFYRAVPIWEDDLLFVDDYDMKNQETVDIGDLRPYRKQ